MMPVEVMRAGDTLGGVEEDFVGLLQRFLEGNSFSDHSEKPLIGHHNHGVYVLAHLGDAAFGLLHPAPTLEQEGLGDDARP